MRKILVSLVAILAIVIWTTPARAVALTTALISDDTLLGAFPTLQATSFLDSTFSVSGGKNEGDVDSAVYSNVTGTDFGVGTVYAYVYQVNMTKGLIQGFSVDIFANSLLEATIDIDGGGVESGFIITSVVGGAPDFGVTEFDDGLGSQAPESNVVHLDSPDKDTFSAFWIADNLVGTETSFKFGFYSLIPPQPGPFNVIDGAGEITSLVVTTSPEPATALLLGSGLLGLLGIRRRRRAA